MVRCMTNSKKYETLHVITHFSDYDTDCGGDYRSVTIHDEMDFKIAEFGDESDDSGTEKADAFVEAINHMQGFDTEVEYADVADITD
jgi:hypothetical protein